MNPVARLSLDLRKLSSGWIISSVLDGMIPFEAEIDEDRLDRLKSLRLQSLHVGNFQTTVSELMSLALGPEGWGRLQGLVDSVAAEEPGLRRCVCLYICPGNELRDVPWELAFASGSFGLTVSVVRVLNQDLPDEDLLIGERPVLRELEALTKTEQKAFAALRSQLTSVGARPAIAYPTREEATSRTNEVGSCDILQLTGHGGPHGGLMLFDKFGGYSDDNEDDVADQEVGLGTIRTLVERCRARLVVVAACGRVEGGDRWSIGDDLAELGAVKAVVSMREPIEIPVLAAFCGGLYSQLLRGEPLDTAVLRARLRLPVGSSSIPQLRLNVGGDLTLWTQPMIAAAPRGGESPSVKPDPIGPAETVPPHRAVALSDELCGVHLDDGRVDTYTHEGDEWDFGAPSIGATLAVSADARVAAALHEDRLDIAWLAVEGGSLVARRPAWVDGLQLPAPLCGLDARVLAVSLVHGARVRVMIATQAGTWWDVISAAHRWGEPHLLDKGDASAAFDLPADHVLAVGGRLRMPDGRPPVFTGARDAISVDCASWAGTQLAVRLDKIGGKVSVMHRPHHESGWTKIDLAGIDLPDQVRHVSVVRQRSRDHRLGQLFVVGADSVPRTVDIGPIPVATKPISLG